MKRLVKVEDEFQAAADHPRRQYSGEYHTVLSISPGEMPSTGAPPGSWITSPSTWLDDLGGTSRDVIERARTTANKDHHPSVITETEIEKPFWKRRKKGRTLKAQSSNTRGPSTQAPYSQIPTLNVPNQGHNIQSTFSDQSRIYEDIELSRGDEILKGSDNGESYDFTQVRKIHQIEIEVWEENDLYEWVTPRHHTSTSNSECCTETVPLYDLLNSQEAGQSPDYDAVEFHSEPVGNPSNLTTSVPNKNL